MFYTLFNHLTLALDRYEKRHKNLAAHVSPAFRVELGDVVTVGAYPGSALPNNADIDTLNRPVQTSLENCPIQRGSREQEQGSGQGLWQVLKSRTSCIASL